MNAEQKQRALTALGMWHSSNDSSQREYQAAELMAALLQELVDAPEAEPFGYFKSEPFGWTDCAETDDGAIALYTAPPVPSVPDGWIRAIDEAMVVHHIGIADRADSYEVAKKKLNALLAITSDIARYCSEPPADVARDAALYCAAQRACAELPEGWEIRIELERSAGTVILVNPDGEDVDYSSDHEYMASDINAAIDAAIEREILGGGHE